MGSPTATITKRNRRGRVLHREGCRRAGGDQDFHVGREQLGDERGKPVVVSFRPAIFDDEVLALDIAELVQLVAEGADEVCLQRGGRVSEEADPV
jgi:hypothetical protein